MGREREDKRLWFISQLSSSCLHECGNLFNQEKGGLELWVIKYHIALRICYNWKQKISICSEVLLGEWFVHRWTKKLEFGK